MGYSVTSMEAWEIEGLFEELTKLHFAGVSHSQIALALNAKFKTSFSKNAVTGKVHRSGLYAKRTASKPELSRASRLPGQKTGALALQLARERSAAAEALRVSQPGRIVRGGFAIAPKFSTSEPAEDLPTFDALPGSSPKPWTQREHNQCSWPVDVEGSDVQHSCCRPVAGGTLFGKSWCPEHLSVGAKPPPAQRKMTDAQRAEHGARIRAGRAAAMARRAA